MISVTRYIEQCVLDNVKGLKKGKPRWKQMILWKSVYGTVYTSWPTDMYWVLT